MPAECLPSDIAALPQSPSISTFGVRRPRICIIAQNAYGALSGGKSGHVGGAEHQTSFLARWLAGQGYSVSLLTWDEGQDEGVVIEGVRVVKMCKHNDGLPGLRFFVPRLTSLFGAMKRADADLYYHNSAEYVTGLAALWCNQRQRKFVYSVASDVAVDPALPALGRPYERWLYRIGLHKAHKIIVQSNRQREKLKAGFNLPSTVLTMPYAGLSDAAYNNLAEPAPGTVAWVGRVASMKRLEWLLDIADRMPTLSFKLAVYHIGEPYSVELERRAKSQPNVEWLGRIPRNEMRSLYESCQCLCCTSSYEGFPNTFIEAWSHGRPVVTSFDPDDIVARHDLGIVARNIDEFVAAFQHLFQDSKEWRTKSSNARNYYAQHHAPEIVMPQVENVLNNAFVDHRASAGSRDWPTPPKA